MSVVTSDRVRTTLVLSAAVLQVLMAPIGSLLPGGEQVGQVSNRYSSPLTPADWAFAIWGPIFLGCLVLAVHQARPSRRGSTLHRRTGPWFALAFLANALWEVVYAQEWVPVSVGLLVLVVVGLVGAGVAAGADGARTSGRADRVLVLGIGGLFLGWALVAVVANAESAAAYLGAPTDGPVGVTVSTALLVGAGALVVVVSRRVHVARWAVVGAAAWGLAGIAAAGPDATVAITAVAVAVLVLGSAARGRSAEPTAGAAVGRGS